MLIIQCLVCGRALYDVRTPEARDWDWFTGYFDRTAVFCPKHKDSGIRHLLFEFSHRKPPNDGQHWELEHAVHDLKLRIQ